MSVTKREVSPITLTHHLDSLRMHYALCVYVCVCVCARTHMSEGVHRVQKRISETGIIRMQAT